MTDLWAIVLPILVATVLSTAAAFATARSAASPQQQAYIAALHGRLKVVEEERDDAQLEIPRLETRIAHLESRVHELETTLREREVEINRLYRRLEADERRLP